jgi:hypothetical protein
VWDAVPPSRRANECDEVEEQDEPVPFGAVIRDQWATPSPEKEVKERRGPSTVAGGVSRTKGSTAIAFDLRSIRTPIILVQCEGTRSE